MKYNVEITINLPRTKVIELFDSTDNLKKWQPGLISFDHVSGTPGEVGAKSKLHYRMGKRDIEMIETITVKNLPDEFSGTYEAKGVWNEVKNFFYEVDEQTTKWVSENEFRCSGFMKIFIFLMPGSFKKETQKYLEQFKVFAEGNS
ncbi:MAG: SRPBCC family protein [Candidatus Marinimicrobia bacterium]|nr:SRPBCC family protein [Candidatus Neomarinimicrobiota bacterium]